MIPPTKMTDEPAQVRPASPDDAPDLARMLHDFNVEYEDPTPGTGVLEARVRKFMADRTKWYLVAGDGSRSLGFAQFDFHPSIWSEGPILFLDELYVKPAHRGNGLGKLMMETLRSAAEERGAAGMEVVTGEDDTAARGLYESFGFRNQVEGADDTRALFYELDFSG